MGGNLSTSNANYVVSVRTGDRRFAGTDATVHIILYDDEGNASSPITLDKCGRNDFEQGQLDTFHIPESKVSPLQRCGKIVKIELWKEDAGLGSDWFVDKIVVENRAINESFDFPVFRWIKNNRHYHVKHLDTSLPHEDEFPEQRKLELEEKKEGYVMDQKIPGGPVQVKTLPSDESFSFDYKWDIVAMKLKLKLITRLISATTRNFKNVQDFYRVYTWKVFPTPEKARRWNDDDYFGLQRIAGLNHSMITLVKDIPEKFPVTDELLKPLLEGLTIREAIDQKRLFMCDFHLLDGVTAKEGYVVCAPIGLFFVNEKKVLLPVAIQLHQKPGPQNPIFTPNCSAWTLAKMWYNNADAMYHQALTHLGFTHLLMEGIAVVSHRHLSHSHPVFKLLAPHFLYIIAINARALLLLVSPGGWVDITMNTGCTGMVEIVGRGFDTWRMNVEGSLPEDLKNRGVDDPDVLPHYHFRDDALLVYNAIRKYVVAYVNLYYPSPDILQNDQEIQNWVADMVKPRNGSEGGLGLQGVPGNGRINTIDELVQILTCAIYSSSAAHTAANFPQYEQYGFPPGYPAKMKGTPPTDPNANVTESDIVNSLANKDEMLDTMIVTQILSRRGTNCLGDFEVQYVFDPKAREIVNTFRKDLADVSKTVTERNSKRANPYPYLDPRSIPNSISI